MIILFHALFLLTRYFIRTLSKTVVCSGFLCVSPAEDSTTSDNDSNKISGSLYEAYFDETGNPRFIPPVYVQRYSAVKSVLEDVRWSGKIKKVVDFGCAEFGLFPYLKHIRGLHEILSVDTDESLLEQYMCRVAPLHSDYLKCREEPLEIKVLHGSIADTDDCLHDCDAVICIELIEHLYPDVLEDVPYTVFGFIKPLVAIFTTPNSEFNVIFPDNTGFRHHDHKFEWDREQFKCWADNIVQRYPEYKVSIEYIGPGPPGTEAVGSCSQMALFIRTSAQPSEEHDSSAVTQEDSAYEKYKLVRHYTYQHCMDTRTDEMKIQDQAGYHIRMLSTCDRFMKNDHVEIPLAVLLPVVEEWTTSIATLRKLLEDAGWKLTDDDPENAAVVYTSYCNSDSSHVSELSNDCETDKEFQPDHVAEESWDQEPLMSWHTAPTCSTEMGAKNDETDANQPQELWDQEPLMSWHTIQTCSSQMESKNNESCVKQPLDDERGEWTANDEKFISKYSFSNHCTPEKRLDCTGVQGLDSKETQTDLCCGKSMNIEDKQNCLCLNLQSEPTNGGIDSPMIESVSIDEPNDKLADSGYPNSASAQDMDLDLTPEQVDEIFTENDVLTSKSDKDSDSISISSDDSVDNDDRHFRPIYVPHNEVLFEVMNVENGDVANNNRDGEGNNAVALPLPLLDENLIPLLEAAEDLDNDNEVRLPEHVDPFPHWLLNLLGIANHGGGDAINFGPGLMDNEGDENLFPVADEGIGDEFGAGSSNTDTSASEQVSDEGLESDNEVEGLPLDPVQEVVFPGDMGAGGEPNIFRGGAGAV